jgi:hypothetical protein
MPPSQNPWSGGIFLKLPGRGVRRYHARPLDKMAFPVAVVVTGLQQLRGHTCDAENLLETLKPAGTVDR